MVPFKSKLIVSGILVIVISQACQFTSPNKDSNPPGQVLILTAPIDGVLKELHVKEGGGVKQGQLLLSIDTTGIALRRAFLHSEMNRLMASIQSPAQQTAALRAKLGNLYFHQGQYESKSISDVTKEDRIQLDYEIIHTKEELVALQQRIEQHNLALKYQMQGVEIQIQILNQELMRYTINAPFTGKIFDLEVHEGEWLSQGLRLFSLQADTI